MSRLVATTVLLCASLALPALAAAEVSLALPAEPSSEHGVGVDVAIAIDTDAPAAPEVARNINAGTMCTDRAELWSARTLISEPLLSWAALTSLPSLADVGSSAASAASQERSSLWCVSEDDPRCSPRPSESVPLDSSLQPQLAGSVFVTARAELGEAATVAFPATYQKNARDGEHGRIERPPRHAR